MRQYTLFVLLAAMLLLCFSGCSQPAAPTMAYETPEEAPGFRNTVLYYATEEGLMVPVMRMIPWEEGIGKAALGYLMDTEENRAAMAMQGLCATLPKGTHIKLRIGDDANATVDLSGTWTAADAAAEKNMLTAIVNTLTEFPSIDTVSVTVEGKSVDKLAHGTPVSGAMSAFALNVEDSPVATTTERAFAMTLYFPNASASLNVPITRYIGHTPTFAAAVQALLDGPAETGLLACFPEDTLLLDASIQNGVATVNFSEGYAGVEETEGLAQACYDALYLTACALQPVAALDVRVEGKAYAPEAVAVSAPLYANEFA